MSRISGIKYDDTCRFELSADVVRQMVAQCLHEQFPGLRVSVGPITGERHPDDVVIRATGVQQAIRWADATVTNADDSNVTDSSTAMPPESALASWALAHTMSEGARVLVVCADSDQHELVTKELSERAASGSWRGDSLFLDREDGGMRRAVHVTFPEELVRVARARFSAVAFTSDVDARVRGRRGDAREWYAEHHRRTEELIDKGALKVADDYFHAAMIFQHGDKPEHYAMANEMARKAVELDPTHRTAKWLFAATKDRHLHSLGKPQIYGTQFRKNKKDDPWTLQSNDETAVTDAERLEYGAPTLADSKKPAEMRVV